MNSPHRGRRQRKTGQPEQGPVTPGMKSGLLRVLPDGSEAEIHAAALDVLENVGLAEAPESTVELITGAGGFLSDTGRLCFPRGLVEDMIAKANRSFVMCGQDPRHDMDRKAPTSISALAVAPSISLIQKRASIPGRF